MADKPNAPQPVAPDSPRFKHDENFVSLYANNVQFESGALDLKMVFGEAEPTADGEVVRQRARVTLSWAEAKLVSYFLQVNLIAYETVNGTIRLPESQMPPEPPPLPAEAAGNKVYAMVRERVIKLHEQFLANL